MKLSAVIFLTLAVILTLNVLGKCEGSGVLATGLNMSDFTIANKSAGLDPRQAFSKSTHGVIAGVYALLFVIAISLNSLVLVSYVRDRRLRTPSNKVILSIAIGDWLHAVLAYPLGVARNTSQNWRMSGATCTWYAFITCFLSYGILLHHAAFSVERAITIHNFEKRPTIERKLNFVIGGLWTSALIWSLFPLFGWSAYVPEGAGVFCSIRWQSSKSRDIVYIACIFLFFFFVPVVAMVIAYSFIFVNMRKMSRNAHDMWGENAAATVEVIRAEGKIARMTFMMSFCFLFAWTPYAVVSLHAIIVMPENISPLVATLPSLFAKTSTCCNPVIYFLLSKKFRKSLGKTLQSLRGRFLVCASAAV